MSRRIRTTARLTAFTVAALFCLAGFPALTALTAATAAGSAGFTATSRDPDPGATTVRGRCIGGGRIKVTVRGLTGEGTYPVEVTGRNVPGGSRWSGRIVAFDDNGNGDDRFRFDDVVADGGTWTISTSFAPQGRHTAFALVARSAGDRRCLLELHPSGPFHGGITFCRPQLVSVLALRSRPDGDLAVRFFAFPLRDVAGDERWTIDVRVSGADGSQQVTVQDRANRRGTVFTTAVLQGFDDPRVFVRATDPDGRHCSMGVNQAEVSTAPLPSLHTAREAISRLTSVG